MLTFVRTMMKRKLLFCFWLWVLLFSACTERKSVSVEENAADTIPVMVMKIRKCAKLYTSEYKIHKIITHDDCLQLKGSFLQQQFNLTLPLTERKIAIPLEATLKAYIDFGTFTEEHVKRRGNRIEILLPDPKVELTESHINHAEIMRHVSFVRSNFTDVELADYENQGRAVILNNIPQLGILDVAMGNATHALMPLLKQMGYKEEDITLTFRKKFTQSDIPSLLDVHTIAYGR